MAQIVAKPKDRLREVLEESNMTQAEAARRAHIGKDRINRYLKGACKPGNIPLYNLSQVFNVNPLWLMGFDVPKRETNAIRNIKSEINSKLDRLNEEQLRKIMRFIEEFIE